MSTPTAVILAAGEGSRMRPLTYTRPKVMLPIANRPILEHLLIEAREAGISDFILVVGYHEEQLRAYFGEGARWNVSIRYTSQSGQAGTADAVRTVEGMVGSRFLLMNGDMVVKRQDIARLLEKETTTIGALEVEDTRDLGLLEVKGTRVVRVHEKVEKAPSNLANAGLYVFTAEVFEAIARTPKSPRGECEITATLQLMIDGGVRVGFQRIGYWLDLSYPWHLLGANEALLAGLEPAIEGEVEPNVVIKAPVSIGAGTVVRSGSYIVGPVVIGRECSIGPNCYIRPSTSIGDGCHIGASVEIKNSIIMNDSDVPHLSYVGDSVIGEGCNLGAGTKIANLRLDEKDISVAGVGTRRRKFGAVLGDGVKTGINASVNVGTMIGNGSFVGPGAVVSGVIAPGSRVFQGAGELPR